MSTEVEHLPLAGLPIPPEALKIPRAIAVADALVGGQLVYVRFIECRASSEGSYQETVVFDVEVERPQVPAADIRCEERIAAVFLEEDDRYPRVLALRSTFPDVLHLNQEDEELPRSLCLYEQHWRDLKLSWTAPAFIERTRDWLKRTAFGILHEEDQPLEPMLLGSPYHLVIPHDALKEGCDWSDRLDVFIPGDGNDNVLLARRSGAAFREKGIRHVATVLKLPPRQHRILGRAPKTLADLADLLQKANIDLLGDLRARLQEWEPLELSDAWLILVLLLPKIRRPEGPVEDVEVRAFLAQQPVSSVGVEIGIWGLHEGRFSGMVPTDLTKRGQGVPVWPVNLHDSLHRGLAMRLNGLSDLPERRIAAVGAGALGSQVVLNLARAGFGPWTIIDEDVLLPHNLARHGLSGLFLGRAKAKALAYTIANSISDVSAEGLIADVLEPGEQGESVDKALKSADVILDLAASVPVSRQLARHPAEARRIAIFLSPSGRDLVLLAEDPARELKLDMLEMQFYRALCTDARLRDHFTESVKKIRYGQSCRDLSSEVPQDWIALHAGVSARALKTVLDSTEARIRIWRADPVWSTVESIEVSVAPVRTLRRGEWMLVTDEVLLEQLQSLREKRKGVETGGVLLGAHDMVTKTVYVVDALPSPSDSVEWPTLYIRGCQDLADAVLGVREITAHGLDYVGEWHSHPDGCPAVPSGDDQILLGWLAERMAPEGKPPLMLIVSDTSVGMYM